MPRGATGHAGRSCDGFRGFVISWLHRRLRTARRSARLNMSGIGSSSASSKTARTVLRPSRTASCAGVRISVCTRLEGFEETLSTAAAFAEKYGRRRRRTRTCGCDPVRNSEVRRRRCAVCPDPALARSRTPHACRDPPDRRGCHETPRPTRRKSRRAAAWSMLAGGKPRPRLRQLCSRGRHRPLAGRTAGYPESAPERGCDIVMAVAASAGPRQRLQRHVQRHQRHVRRLQRCVQLLGDTTDRGGSAADRGSGRPFPAGSAPFQRLAGHRL